MTTLTTQQAKQAPTRLKSRTMTVQGKAGQTSHPSSQADSTSSSREPLSDWEHAS